MCWAAVFGIGSSVFAVNTLVDNCAISQPPSFPEFEALAVTVGIDLEPPSE